LSADEKEKNYDDILDIVYEKLRRRGKADRVHEWSKIETMTVDQYERIPDDALQKYGRLVRYKLEYEDNERIKERDKDPRYQEHRLIDRYMTNKQKEELERLEFLKRNPPHPNRDSDDFKKKQPRLQLNYNYNFFQHKEFTKFFETQVEKDKKKDLLEKRLLKYLKNVEDKHTDKKLDEMFLKREEIPDYEDVDITELLEQKDKKNTRLRIKTRSSSDTTNYDAWRVFDRGLIRYNDHELSKCTLRVSPVALKRAFGEPLPPRHGVNVTGEYDFEDLNLDTFLIFDYNQTLLSFGFNREDAYYEKQKKYRELHREKKWPSPDEFWNSTEIQVFKIDCSTYADWRKFRRWIIEKCDESADKIPYEEELDTKFGKPNLYDEYNKQYEINNDMTVFKYDFTYFMNEEDTKKLLKSETSRMTAFKNPDMKKAERIDLEIEELMRAESKAKEEKKLR